MADSTIDVLMRVVGKSGDMAADSLTIFTTSVGQDELRDGFRPGYFCDLIDFSFSAGVESGMSKGAKARKEQQDEEERFRKFQANQPGGTVKPEPPKPKWKKSAELEMLEKVRKYHGGRAEKRLAVEKVDMQPVEYTRIMDSSSTLMFKALAECETLDTISIVKRKAAGTANSGLCYLRLDFSQVLLTKLDFKDEQQVMHESGTFIYRKLSIQYRPQLPSGALGAIVQSSWTMRGASA